MTTQTHTFEYKSYTIMTSLGERNIYIRFTDQINFVTFEGNMDAKELRVQFDLADIYTLICEAFNETEGFTVGTNINNGFMKVGFYCVVGGFLKVNFEAILKEKIMSNDGQLTVSFNRLEQKYEALTKKLESLERKMATQQEENMALMNAISYASVQIAKKFFSINTTELKLRDLPTSGDCDLSRVQYLYNLETIEILLASTDVRYEFSNATVKSILFCTFINTGSAQPLLVKLLDKCPNLECLTIRNTNFSGADSIVNTLALSPEKNKLKTINLVTCTSMNVLELQNYCQTNGIALNIS